MKIVCDACSAKYSIADEKVRGKVFKIRCKKCSNIIVVRGAVSEQGDAAAPQYDQKQSTVAGDGQRADSAAEVSESAVWHLVIDQEQVGPMTVEEVRDRIHRGEVDSEGFVWREGFGDWERLADVEEFSSMVGSAPAGNGGVGVLFGGSSGAEYDEARAAQNDPADLFATRGDDASAAADLFAGTGLSVAPSADGSADPDGLFGGDGGLGVGDAPEKPVVAALTAQRNENSVLFSLNNLAALASDAPRPKPAPSPPSSPSGSGSMASVAASKAPQSEGSGLIDIRSMAQVYLGDSKSPSKPVGSAEDLPVFSQTAFDTSSPVLLPTVQPAVNNRLLIALIGLIGVLVVAAAVLVLIVLRGGGDSKKIAAADPAAAAAPAPAAAPSAPAGEAKAPAAAAPAGESSGGEAAAPAAAPAAEDDDPDKGEPAADDSSDDSRSASRDKDRDQKDRKDRKDRDRDRGKDKDKDKDKGRDKRADRRSGDDSSSGTKSAAAAPAPDPTATSGCDEVTCLVEPDKPCCKKYSRRSSGSSSRSSGSADPSLPDQPSRSDVASGIGNVKGNVSACGSRAPGGGKVTVKIKISPTGSVSNASASGGSSSLNGCVESAVRRARFPKSQYGVSVNYPFIF